MDETVAELLRKGLVLDHVKDVAQLHITSTKKDAIDRLVDALPRLPHLGLTYVARGRCGSKHGVLLRPSRDFDLALGQEFEVALYYRPNVVLVGDDIGDLDWAFGVFPEEALVPAFQEGANYDPHGGWEGLYAGTCLLGREHTALLKAEHLTTSDAPGDRVLWSYRVRVDALDVRAAPQPYIEVLFREMVAVDSDVAARIAV